MSNTDQKVYEIITKYKKISDEDLKKWGFELDERKVIKSPKTTVQVYI